MWGWGCSPEMTAPGELSGGGRGLVVRICVSV